MQTIKTSWSALLREKAFALVQVVAGALFIAAGIHRFWVRPERLSLLDLLGCFVGVFGGFFLLVIADYLLHHARLVFIPWIIFLLVLAFVQPHSAIGLGLALWYMFASQLGN